MPPSIIIAGSLAPKPRHGGHTWVFLQYLLGFRRLGWEVTFLDQLQPETCKDASDRPCGVEESFNLSFMREVMRRFGLEDRWALLHEGRVLGISRAELIDRVRRCDLFLNVMGFVKDPEILGRARRRVFLDIDPAFGQMWKDLGLCDTFAGHDQFVTIGENIGKSGCLLPTCGLKWITTSQPIVLEHWPVGPGPRNGAFTSVVSWRGAYGPVEHGGKMYGLRAHELRRFAALPRMTDAPFRLALDIHPGDDKDKQLLLDNDWTIVSPRDVAGDPWAYQRFIRESAAEFMIAKNIYVQTRSGWFSDRSICYLASGRPVVAQDTGLPQRYRTGAGLVLFDNPEGAAEAVRRVCRDYEYHARAARAFAEEHFDSDKVLTRLLDQLGVKN